MWLLDSFAEIVLPQLLDGAIQAVGGAQISMIAKPVAGLLRRTFVDNSAGIEAALVKANGEAWTSIEVALAGPGLLGRLTKGAETVAVAARVREFLDGLPAGSLPDDPKFRGECLVDLRAARKAGLLAPEAWPGGDPDLRAERRAIGLADLAARDPHARLETVWRAMDDMAGVLRRAGHVRLGELLAARPPGGESVLVLLMRHHFRRAVEDDERLHRGLMLETWKAVTDDLRNGMAALSEAQRRHGAVLESGLSAMAEFLAGFLAEQRAANRASEHRDRHTHDELAEIKSTLAKLNRQLAASAPSPLATPAAGPSAGSIAAAPHPNPSGPAPLPTPATSRVPNPLPVMPALPAPMPDVRPAMVAPPEAQRGSVGGTVGPAPAPFTSASTSGTASGADLATSVRESGPVPYTPPVVRLGAAFRRGDAARETAPQAAPDHGSHCGSDDGSDNGSRAETGRRTGSGMRSRVTLGAAFQSRGNARPATSAAPPVGAAVVPPAGATPTAVSLPAGEGPDLTKPTTTPPGTAGPPPPDSEARPSGAPAASPARPDPPDRPQRPRADRPTGGLGPGSTAGLGPAFRKPAPGKA